MKIEEIELTRITKTDIETKEGKKEIYTATFEDKEKGIKININQEKGFDLVMEQKYTFKIDTEQKNLS